MCLGVLRVGKLLTLGRSEIFPLTSLNVFHLPAVSLFRKQPNGKPAQCHSSHSEAHSEAAVQGAKVPLSVVLKGPVCVKKEPERTSHRAGRGSQLSPPRSFQAA